MMDRKRFYLIGIALVSSAFLSIAEVPAGYYDPAVGKSGNALQEALSDLIGDRELGYDNLWEAYRTTDRRDDGKVWDMYSSTTDFVFGSDQCGSYSREGDCYNREHSVPKSWLGGRKYSDAHVVVPTDGYVNNRRSNMPFGEVGSTSYVSNGGFSRVGTCSVAGYSGRVFEPADEYKGDFARIYFYMATRYTTACGGWSGEGSSVFSGSFPYLKDWTREMMLRWHQEDPVSEKEIDRNDAVYQLQGNRNPFIDYPELVDLIFGEQTSTPFTPGATAYIESPAAGSTIEVGTVVLGTAQSSASTTVALKGHNLSGTVTLSLSGANASYFSLSQSTADGEAANNGVSIVVTYTPAAEGSHTATLAISGGGLTASHSVQLSGTAREGFAALAATEVYETSFTAQWTAHSQATDYELSVWHVESGTSVEEQILLDETFTAAPDWETSGYTALENGSLRLASGSNDGSITTPALDLSSTPATLVVTCSPYRSSDNSHLYISVDGTQVADVDCSAGEVTETITLPIATTTSTVTLLAKKGARVYLQHVVIKKGGDTTLELVDGYPCHVGNVLQHKVTGLTEQQEYRYSVKAYSGETLLDESNVVEISTSLATTEKLTMPNGLYIYAYGGRIYVDGAPANARLYYYSIDGRLCGTRTLHAQRESVMPAKEGIYIVQIVTSSGSFATRVMVH